MVYHTTYSDEYQMRSMIDDDDLGLLVDSGSPTRPAPHDTGATDHTRVEIVIGKNTGNHHMTL